MNVVRTSRTHKHKFHIVPFLSSRDYRDPPADWFTLAP